MTLPRSLCDRELAKFVEESDGNVAVRSKASLYDPETGGFAAIASSGAVETGELIRLVGGNFESGVLQPNIWSSALVNGGTAMAVTGEAVLATNTTADGSVALQSARRARFTTATLNKAHQAVQTENPDNTDVIRRWGMYDPVTPFASGDGVYWENDSGTITLRRIKAGVVVQTVAEASFNGNDVPGSPGVKFIKNGNVHIYEIVYNAGSALFFQSRRLVHKMTFVDAVGYETVHLYLGAECININGNTTANELKTRGFACSRIGSLAARPDFFRITGGGTSIIKNSPGSLERIIIVNPGTGNAVLTVYNNSVAAGEIVAVIDLTLQVGQMEFQLDFDRGLSVVASGSGFEVLIVFN